MVWLKPENRTDICGIFRYLAASSDICGRLQIFAGIFRYLQASLDICGHLQISPTHQQNIDLSHGIYRKPAAAARHPWSLAYEAQESLTLAWPGRTESRQVICRPTWPLANTAMMVRKQTAQPFSIFHMTDQYFFNTWLISAVFWRCPRYPMMPTNIWRCRWIFEDIYLLFLLEPDYHSTCSHAHNS